MGNNRNRKNSKNTNDITKEGNTVCGYCLLFR